MKMISLPGCAPIPAENITGTASRAEEIASDKTAQASPFVIKVDEPLVVAYGMGVDSTAMLVGLWRHGTRPDLILFADTGSEKPETYAYLPIINAWLKRVGFPSVTVLKRNSPKVGDTSLHGECLRKSVLPSPAYGGKSCSLKWKVDPQLQFVRKAFGWNAKRQTFTHGPFITKLVGYDAGPADAKRIMKAKDVWPPGHRNLYPLAAAGWDRARCEAEIAAAGLPSPGKSACFMCPSSKLHEVHSLGADHPELAAIAVTMEARAHARGLTTVQGLGRRWAWSDILAPTNPRAGERVAP